MYIIDITMNHISSHFLRKVSLEEFQKNMLIYWLMGKLCIVINNSICSILVVLHTLNMGCAGMTYCFKYY